LERRYRKTGTSTDRRFWVDATRRQILLHRRKKEYWRDRLELCGRSSTAPWRSLSTLLGRHRDVACDSDHTADGFATFFVRKIEGVRSGTAGLPPPPVLAPATSPLASFRPRTQTEIRQIIMTSPVKSCSLDPVPTFLVREYVDVLLPYIILMVNASLSQGRPPVSQKHTIVTPLLKKTGLDSSDMNRPNFRPVSNLSFISKVVERLSLVSCTSTWRQTTLLPRFQSAYRKYHSTETAMQRVWSDVLAAADDRQMTLLGLLDLSAAFDCVDHSMLLEVCFRFDRLSP